MAAGIIPGQALFVNMFAKAGIYGGACEDTAPPCDGQVATLSTMFGLGVVVALCALAVNGLLFDIYGGRMLGVVGSVLVFIGLVLESAAIFSAINGTDAYTNWLVPVGVLITDWGSLTNAYSFFGLVWHYPGSTALILSLSNATYQVSALLPVLLQYFMDTTGLNLGYGMLAFAMCTLFTAPTLSVIVPSQQDYYDQAKVLLGVPLPKVKKSFDFCNQIKMAWKAVRKDLRDHVFLIMGLALATTMAAMYNSMSSAFGKFLFGSQAAGDKLANMQVISTAVVGAFLAPFVAKVSDVVGLQITSWVLTLFVIVPGLLLLTPEWWAAWVTTFGYCLFLSLSQLFMNRYFLHYAPPNRLGTYLGMCSILVVSMMIPAFIVSDMCIMSLPEEQRFVQPFLTLSVLSVISLIVFNLRFRFAHGGKGVPSVPVMLPEDELELCMPFGASDLDEAAEFTGLTKEVLFKKLADPDPQTLKELMSLVDTDKVKAAFAKKGVDDVIKMLEAVPELEDEDDDDVDTATPGTDGPQSDLFSGAGSPFSALEASPSAAEGAKEEADGFESQEGVAQASAQKLAEEPVVDLSFSEEWLTQAVEDFLEEPGMSCLRILEVLAAGEAEASGVKLTLDEEVLMEAVDVFLLAPGMTPERILEVLVAGEAKARREVAPVAPKEDILAQALRVGAPEEHGEAAEEGGEDGEKRELARRARALGEALERLVREGDAAGCKRFMLEVPVDDQWECFVAMEDWMTEKQAKDLETKFNKLVPPRQWADLMKRNPELKNLIARLMARELQRSVDRFRGKT